MSPSRKKDLERLKSLAHWYEGSFCETPASPSSVWLLNRIGDTVSMIAHEVLAESAQYNRPCKLIAGTPFRTVPIDDYSALAEGREGLVHLVGTGELVFPTLPLPFRTLVHEDSQRSPSLPRTIELSDKLTELRGRMFREYLLQEQVS